MQTEWECWVNCRRWLEGQQTTARLAGDAAVHEAASYALEVVDRLGMNTLAAVVPANRLPA